MVFVFRYGSDKPRNYFAMQRALFKFLGITFKETESRTYKIYSVVFLFFTVCTYPLIQMVDIFKFYNDMEILSNTVTFTSLVVMALVKCLVLYSNRESVGNTLNTLEEGVFRPNSEDGDETEVIWVKQCILTINRQCLFYLGSVYMTMVAGISDCLQRRLTSSDYRDWKFPLGSFTLFDVSRSPNYEIACIYQIICVWTCFTSTMLSDVLISGILAHISTQFHMLQNRICKMTTKAYQKMLEDQSGEIHSKHLDPKNIPWKYLQEILKETITYHVKLTDLGRKFEKQFSYLVMVQFLTTSSTLCFTMYYCSTLPVTDARFLQYIVGAIDIAIQVLFYCYWGNEVTIASRAIADACYRSNFVGTDLRFQKGLILMMQRSQRPMILTAGKFVGLLLNTYVLIIRASYSYYMVLNRL